MQILTFPHVLMKYNFIALLILALPFFASAQPEKYSRVSLPADAATLARMQAMGLAVDHVVYRGNSVVAELSGSELQKLRLAGIHYKEEINDLQNYYAERARKDLQEAKNRQQQLNNCGGSAAADTVQVPAGFSLGSMGGFFKYEEMLAHLDTMAALYPHLITIKQPIAGHQTIEGRPIYWVKLSDNPMQDESAAEPQVLYNAVHHAREPMSMAQTIFYMYYLLENYNSNDLVKDIVDNTELFFVPCLNPDGYIYNQTIAPNGGGMWRKNRRDNGNGTFGVDLNRNYGYNWGFNNLGSSPDGSTEVYRGTAPFSEPETQAMKFFCETHQFKNALNSHAFGNVLIHPFGHDFDVYPPPADSARFVEWGLVLTEHNNYGMGTTPQVLGYLGNGDSDAWMYGEQTTKPEIYSYTPETGGQNDGFWPLPSRIIPLAKGMFHTNLNMALLARQAIKAKVSESAMVATLTDSVRFSLINLGLQSGGAVTVSLQSNNPLVIATGTPLVFSGLPNLVSVPGSLGFELSSGITENTSIDFELIVEQDGKTWVTPMQRIYYTSPPVLSDPFSSDQGFSGNWSLTTNEYYSAPSSLTDSPAGNYPPNVLNTTIFNQVIDLTNATDAFITFWAKWDIERGWDYVQVRALPASGAVALCGRYTKTGNGQFQPNGQPLYDGRQPVWVEERMSLQDFIGQQIELEFLIVTDNFTERDGFYVDDLEVHVLSVAGVAGQLQEPAFSLGQAYPNPATGTASVAWELPVSSSSAKLIFTDVLGREVYAGTLEGTKGVARINVQNMAAGVYGYYMKTGELRSAAKRLVVVK